ncbi:MAG TPA: ABC transporter substrate-binding protein [Stellaceae bacterium]|nr:ABC transporter substrate-binding protein [Stellaceae bacterium]
MKRHVRQHKTGFTRRTLIRAGAGTAGLLAMPAILRLSARSAYADADPKSIVKVAPEVDLKVFDPIWTTATVTTTYGYLVYDTLFSVNMKLELKPQMVERHEADDDGLTYRFMLRDGLKWHDGTAVTAKDCVASIRRWAARFGEAKIMMERAASLDATDEKTFVLKLKEPFGPVLQTLANPIQVAFMMPQKVAETDPFTQITTKIGSGPFIFVEEEWKPGARVVFRKNPDYKPRSEPSDGYTGGKAVHVERVEWTVIPDAAVQSNALAAGELDYLTNAVPDQVPQLRSNPNITVGILDPLGWQLHIRMNSLNPPFNNAKARQALQMLVVSRQEDYLSATGYTGDMGKACLSPFVCGSPNELKTGTERFQKFDPGKIKALFKEGGYNGEPIVLMDPTDQPSLHPQALVLAEQLKEVGVNVDLQAMDWATLVGRRSIKAPPSQDHGGWNIFPTAWPSSAMMDPIINAPIDSSCDQKNWFGWPCDDKMQKLRLDYLAARNADDRKKVLEQIQTEFFEEAPYAYAGQYFPPMAYRKDRLKGVIGMVNPVFWNMEKFSA